MDGDFDYSQLSRPQLEEALTRIDRARYPINYQRILRELEVRPPESPAAQSAQAQPSVLNLIAWYSIGLVVAYVVTYLSVGFVGTILVAVMHQKAATGADAVPPTWIRSLIAIAAPLVLYFHLARTYPDKFLRAAAGIAIVASLICMAISYIPADAKTPGPATVFVTTVMLNFSTASLVGTLNGMRQIKPPANKRWRDP